MTRAQRLEQDGDPNPVLFYSPADPWGEFSNFSQHPVVAIDPWTGYERVYLTGEHRYQAMKADNQKDHDYVLEVNNPGGAKNRGRQVSLRAGWGKKFGDYCYFVMLETVMLKAVQRTDVMERLYETFERNIYEDSPVDDIWGWRYEQNYSGANLLGLAWMHAREIIL